jgi:hypothetical protein
MKVTLVNQKTLVKMQPVDKNPIILPSLSRIKSTAAPMRGTFP